MNIDKNKKKDNDGIYFMIKLFLVILFTFERHLIYGMLLIEAIVILAIIKDNKKKGRPMIIGEAINMHIFAILFCLLSYALIWIFMSAIEYI